MKNKLHIVWRCNKCYSSKKIEEGNDCLKLGTEVRKCYLDHLQKVLLRNYQSCVGEKAGLHFSVNDVHRCAADMELQAMRKCVVVVLYQRAMAQMITNIKKETLKQKIHKNLRKFSPGRRDMKTQTACDVKTAAVQTRSSLQEDCLPHSTETEQEADSHSQDAVIKQESSSPPPLQQAPPPSPPTLDDIPLPGTDPPQSVVVAQNWQPGTTQCQVAASANTPTQTQAPKMQPVSAPVLSSVGKYPQQDVSSSEPLLPAVDKQHTETPFNDQKPVIAQPFLANSQLQLNLHPTNLLQVSALNGESQVQHASQQHISSVIGQSQLQHASQQNVSSLSGQSQLQHASQQNISSLNGQSQLQHASLQNASYLSGQSQNQCTVHQNQELLHSELHLQQPEHLDSRDNLPNVVHLKMVSPSSKSQPLHECDHLPTFQNHQCQPSANASEKELQKLALQHLQAAYEKWLHTATRQQRLTIARQQMQSSGQVLQSAKQQKLQAFCLRRLRTAYQGWSQESSVDTLRRLQTVYIQWLDASTASQLASSDDAREPTSNSVTGDGRSRSLPPSSLLKSSRPQQQVHPSVRQSRTSVSGKRSQLPTSNPGQRGNTRVPDSTGGDGVVLRNLNLVRKYKQQGKKGVIEVEASPIPVVLSCNSDVQHKVQFQQQPCNPNNIEIIPISEETLVKIEADEEDVQVIPCSPCLTEKNEIMCSPGHTEENTLPISPCCKESDSIAKPLSKINDSNDRNIKDNISERVPIAASKPADSDDDTQGSGPLPAFSSTDSETSRSSTSSLESSANERESASDIKRDGNIENEMAGEESVEPVICTEVEEDFQTKLLLRELLSGGNTPTDELIEGTEIPYDAIVSGLQELDSHNVKKRKSDTDLQLPKKKPNTDSMDVRSDKSAREEVVVENSDVPGKGFWVRERLAQENALAQRWRKLDGNVLKKARKKQQCVRLFGWDEDLTLTERELNICKGRIIPWIVRELKPFYRQGRVISRPVFKSVARHTANRLIGQNCYPGVRDVQKIVTEFFKQHTVVASVDDVF